MHVAWRLLYVGCWMLDVGCWTLHVQGEAVGKRPESQRGAKGSSPAERQEDPGPTARCDLCHVVLTIHVPCDAIKWSEGGGAFVARGW